MGVKYFKVLAHGVILATGLGAGCSSSTTGTTSDGTGSDVATSVVSGAVSNTAGGSVAQSQLPYIREKGPRFWRFFEQINPIRPAWALSLSCTPLGGNLSPAYSGPGTYTYTPESCSITWGNGKTSSSIWSGVFTLTYGPSCNSSHKFYLDQAADCSVNRTTPSGGNTRTLTGPDGNSYAITHDTNGATSGWDTSVSPAPNNGGVSLICVTGGCASEFGVVIGGSHLTGTMTPSGGTATTIWDHTVSTGATALTTTVSSGRRVVNGAVTVQHNLAKFTATATFNNAGYESGCCFPTSGSVTTTTSGGGSETLAFSSTCGEATLTDSGGTSSAYTLKHCL